MTREQYQERLRSYIKDHDYINRLLSFSEENSDEELGIYLDLAMTDLHLIPPAIFQYSYETVPVPDFIILSACIHCLLSNGIANSRNELTYNNGGITVKVPDGDKYLRHFQILMQQVESYKRAIGQMKVGQNLSNGFGGVESPYFYINEPIL